MAHKKRGKKLFRWSKSDLPDDANTQVLLLGVTRLDTPPKLKPKRPHTYHLTTAEQRDFTAADLVATSQKSHRFHSIGTHLNHTDIERRLNETKPTTLQTDKSSKLVTEKSKRNFHTFFGRLNRNWEKVEIDKDIENEQQKRNSRATFDLLATPPYDGTHLLADSNDRIDVEPKPCGSPSPVIESPLQRRKRTTTTARLTRCLPYCTRKNESREPDSLASSFRLTECCNEQNLICDQTQLCASDLTQTLCNRVNNRSNSNNNNSNLFNNLNIMDRSVYSIGSCSLDVDAESTDFSDTSGSLNVCTPSSGKDFTREFTSRIHERCQLPVVQQQQTKTVLDPSSGKISTILSPTAAAPIDALSPQASPAKKPSYLNLACCVNGYSNLTTYDSKFRQSINKSREVSPIRPITHTIQYNRGDGNYLVVPAPAPLNDSTKSIIMDAQTIMSPEKRFFSKSQQKSADISSSGHDVTDNINTNGCTTYYKKTVMHTTTTSHTIMKDNDGDVNKTSKSFIQQRVERLYGPSALAQGLYSPKKPKNDDAIKVSTVLVEKSQNSSKFNASGQRNGHTVTTTSSSSATVTRNHDVENVDVDAENEALPVLRHLRPEFRAQLPMLSPKRSVAIVKSPPSSTKEFTNGVANGKIDHQNNANESITTCEIANGVRSGANENKPNSQSHDVHKAEANCITPTNKNSTTSNNFDIESEPRHVVNIAPKLNGSCSNSSSAIVTETMNSVNKLRLNEIDRSVKEPSVNGKNIQSSADANTSSTAVSKVKGTDATALPNFTVPTASTITTTDTNGNHKTEETKNALYFLNTVLSERDRLIGLAIVVEGELEELLKRGDIEEEVLGFLRSVAGKARLLATQKFKQFEGLCHQSLNQVSGDAFPPPTPEDLQGFWDMVMLQVDHVDSLYTEFETIRTNDWKKPIQVTPKAPQGAKLVKRPVSSKASASAAANGQNVSGTTKKSAAAIAAAQKREAQRKQLMEMKRKNKLAMTANSETDNIHIPSTVIVEQSQENAIREKTNDDETNR